MPESNKFDLQLFGDIVREAYQKGHSGVIMEGRKFLFKLKGTWIFVFPENGTIPCGMVEVEKYINSKVLS